MTNLSASSWSNWNSLPNNIIQTLWFLLWNSTMLSKWPLLLCKVRACLIAPRIVLSILHCKNYIKSYAHAKSNKKVKTSKYNKTTNIILSFWITVGLLARSTSYKCFFVLLCLYVHQNLPYIWLKIFYNLALKQDYLFWQQRLFWMDIPLEHATCVLLLLHWESLFR